MANISRDERIAAYWRRNDPKNRFVDLAIQLWVFDRAEDGHLFVVDKSRIYGGRWDTRLEEYRSEPERVFDVPCTIPAYETIAALCPAPGLWGSEKKKGLISGGRGGGKSQIALTVAHCFGIEHPFDKAKLISPTYQLGKEALWDKFFDETPFWMHLDPQWPEGQKSEKRLPLVNGFSYRFAHAQDEHSLRAGDASLVVVDERQDVAQRKIDVASFQLRKRKHYIFLQVCTAKAGSDAEEEKARFEADEAAGGVSFTKTFTSYSNVFIPTELYDDAKRFMDPKLYEQEVLGRWVVLGDTAYWPFERETHVQPVAEAERVLRELHGDYMGAGDDITAQVLRQRFRATAKYLIGMDFNVAPMVAVVYRIFRSPAGMPPIAWAVDEVILPTRADATQMGLKLKKRGYAKSVIVVDANAQHSTGGASSATLLKRLGFKVVAPATNPDRVDRKNAYNAKLLNAAGEITMLIDSKCRNQIRARQVQEVDPDGKPTKDGVWDHHTDAGDYPIHRLWPVAALERRFGYAA